MPTGDLIRILFDIFRSYHKFIEDEQYYSVDRKCVCVYIDACGSGCMWEYVCVYLCTPAQAYRCVGAFLMTHIYTI